MLIWIRALLSTAAEIKTVEGREILVGLISPPVTDHTCDKLRKGIREIFLSFQGGFSKMYRIYRKLLNSDEGNFGKKWYVLEEILGLISGSIPDDQRGLTCMTD